MGKWAVITFLAALLGAGAALAAEPSPPPGLTAADCRAPASASLQALCTDSGLRQLIEGVQDVPYVRLGRAWTLDADVFRRCDSTLDARACLDQEYRMKVKAVQAESAKRATAYVPDGNKADAKALLARLAGLYKHRVRTADGPGHEAENVFEIVGVGDAAAYVRMQLFFYDGQTCGIAGVAEYKKIGGFVFQDPDRHDQCLLTVSLTGGEVGFSDPNGSCQKFCGTRGSLTEETFLLKQKKKARSLSVLRKTPEFQQAMQDYTARRAGVAKADR
ncbi:hypothetical protein [Azospirillum sp. B4]|uniref:hypothetical protein n=1 Tax=Azospirillum sp. B4 TaxID=95605 RepID=UPI0003464D73|nr:hypothetical protein [Azospirillum sp. B4]